MRIIVCIKQVPSTNEVHLDPVTGTIQRDGRQSVTNPYDTFSLEEAVRLKERYGGEIQVLSMGIPGVEALLRDAVSRGADAGLLMSDRAFAGSDTLVTSYTLSLGVKQSGPFDLILCGKMAIDGDTAQIGPELAEHLGIPHVADVTSILSAEDGTLTCERERGGARETIRVRLPALLTIQKDINMPRMPSIAGVRRGMEASIRIIGAADAGADPARTGLDGSPTQVVRTYTPERSSKAVVIGGTPSEQASTIKTILEEVLK